MAKNTIQERYGIRYIEKVVVEEMKSDWQEIHQSNDDGIDGFITFRKRGEVTGEVVFVQSKCYANFQDEPDGLKGYIGLNIGKKYIEKHIPRWNKMIAPVVLIFTSYMEVSDKAIAWWVDVNDAKSYSDNVKSYILIPKHQRFKGHSIGDLKKICGFRHQDYELPRITLKRTDVSYFKLSSKINFEAKKFYRDWSNSDISERTNPHLGEILISRVGWRHITRKSRKTERVIQSWHLLGTAKKIITTISTPENIGRSRMKTKGDWNIIENYILLRAFVTFPHRYESSVSVVLKRHVEINKVTGESSKVKIWFYSVYETRRGRTPKRLAR